MELDIKRLDKYIAVLEKIIVAEDDTRFDAWMLMDCSEGGWNENYNWDTYYLYVSESELLDKVYTLLNFIEALPQYKAQQNDLLKVIKYKRIIDRRMGNNGHECDMYKDGIVNPFDFESFIVNKHSANRLIPRADKQKKLENALNYIINSGLAQTDNIAEDFIQINKEDTHTSATMKWLGTEGEFGAWCNVVKECLVSVQEKKYYKNCSGLIKKEDDSYFNPKNVSSALYKDVKHKFEKSKYEEMKDNIENM
ncbi:hypothetical protein DNU06_10055 [Putridiphycobacter roseus]|uniref:Uncharacterized protein n=1 Tax=Putridiphycobacter roseus TaxID=2219161 RepID=A0A2W1NQX8_9FLAO|nr:hypothetical protein [Putridiphycobacter roseus]PZE17078.1 hypothetical protein DNU06_10055 [Putridiphycobacter roseus]